MRAAAFLKPLDWNISNEKGKLIINPSDYFALNEAAKIVKVRGGEVVAFMIGNKEYAQLLKGLYGATEAILLSDEIFTELDPFSKAEIIVAALKKSKPFDLLIFGEFSHDSSHGLLPYIVAEKLNLPHISKAIRIWNEDSKIVCECVLGNELYIKEARMPVVVSMLDVLAYGKVPVYDFQVKEVKIWDSKFLGIKELQRRLKIIEKREAVRRKNIMIEFSSYEELADKVIELIKLK